MRWSLFGEIFTMAWDTLRGNKLRSALTVLGVVIGMTASIVGMTWLSAVRSVLHNVPDSAGSDRTRSSWRRFGVS